MLLLTGDLTDLPSSRGRAALGDRARELRALVSIAPTAPLLSSSANVIALPERSLLLSSK